MDQLNFKTEDSIDISANHYTSGHDCVLIICPGFLMHKNSTPFISLSQKLSESFDILTIDFRGHGTSNGEYTFTSRESLDLKAAIGFCKERYKKIGVIGFSLGGAVAINEVSENTAVNRLMVISAPADFYWIENRFLTKEVIASTIKKFDWKMVQVRFGNILLRKPRPIDNIVKISPRPVLFVHGDKDTIVKPRHSLFLYKKAKEPKRLVKYENCLHAEDVFHSENFDNFISLCLEWFKDDK
ncbi:MAG: alpha/beta hydrolase [Candidatus Omnitrophota bacterium]